MVRSLRLNIEKMKLLNEKYDYFFKNFDNHRENINKYLNTGCDIIDLIITVDN